MLLINTNHNLSIVAYHNDLLVGYSLGICTNKIGCIVSFAVHPEYRRQNIGFTILKLTLSSFENIIDLQKIFLHVRVNNTIAQKLYEKVGFIKTSTIQKYYKEEEDAFIMVKKI